MTFLRLLLHKVFRLTNIPVVFATLLATTTVYLVIIVSQTARLSADHRHGKNNRPGSINFVNRVNIPLPLAMGPAPSAVANSDNNDNDQHQSNYYEPVNITVNSECLQPSESELDGFCTWPVHLRSGYGTGILPIICWQNRNVLGNLEGAAQAYRGFHAVVVKRENPLEPAAHLVFDTYLADDDLANFLLYHVDEGDILLAASHDDMQNSLKDFTRNILKHFGSNAIAHLQFRDAFVMVGQKGAQKGTALELLRHRRTSEEYPERVSLTGCFNPLDHAPLKPLPPEYLLRQGDTMTRIGLMPNCGLQYVCPSETLFPVLIKTGIAKSKGPELCIDSYLVFYPGYSSGSRGFNLAIYDPEMRAVISQDSFDPSILEPTRMVRFLDSVQGDNMLIGVVHEDASQDDNIFEEIFSRFGITIGSQLYPSSVGYFIAQRNSSSLALEAVRHNFHVNSNDIEIEPLELLTCLPKQMRNLRLPDVKRGTHIANLLEQSSVKTEFCEKYPGSYGELCTQPFSVTTSFARGDMFSFVLPIFIMAGSDLRALSKTLITTIGQNFLVDFDMAPKIVCASQFMAAANFEEFEELVNLFTFRLVLLESETFDSLYEDCLRYAAEGTLSNKEDWFAFIEPGVELGPDFFNFLHQLIPAVANVSGVAISGWNRNSNEGGSEAKAYLTNNEKVLPSPCFLANARYMTDIILPNFTTCCNGRRYMAWQIPHGSGPFAYPEVSRCFKMPLQCSQVGEELEIASCHEFHLRKKPRRTTIRIVSEPIKLVHL